MSFNLTFTKVRNCCVFFVFFFMRASYMTWGNKAYTQTQFLSMLLNLLTENFSYITTYPRLSVSTRITAPCLMIVQLLSLSDLAGPL